jgi:cation diffusion facilitator CzcD-associated flavoprotein CzcO
MESTAEIDVLIIGAGISGIGCAYYLGKHCPEKSYVIVESRTDLGGTWDLFRYPGIRSDSDLFTFGYEFKIWDSERAIADGESIKAYIAETAREHGIDKNIRYQHRVVQSRWSTENARWHTEVERVDTGEKFVLVSKWLFSATGYYRYDKGFSPEFAGSERFKGEIIHPQKWPENLDYAGKRVTVIGSGATAITLLPAMAETAAHVTMIQRTPSYVLPLPADDAIAKWLRKHTGKRFAYEIARRKNIARQRFIYWFCQQYPNAARKAIRWVNTKLLPEGYPVDVHFNPTYSPWDQRLCAAPGGDLFKVIKEGKATVITDKIKTFDETGIELESGAHVDSDIIITATGLNLLPMGGIKLSVDGEPLRLPEAVSYKGVMLSGVPNYVVAIGYTSSSWTLKIGLLCEYFCRLLKFMDSKSFDQCVPVADPSMPTRPIMDFGAGYVKRSMDLLPRQGNAYPWLTSMDYYSDAKLLRKGRIDDPNLRFTVRPSNSKKSSVESVAAK